MKKQVRPIILSVLILLFGLGDAQETQMKFKRQDASTQDARSTRSASMQRAKRIPATNATNAINADNAGNTISRSPIAKLPPITQLPFKAVDPNSVTPKGMVKVTLKADDVWYRGFGYQLLLDKDATAYGSVFSPDAESIGNCNAAANLYAPFEYKIPENADPVCTTSNMVLNGSVTIHIPAGTYDLVIINPWSEDPRSLWICEYNGSQDNYVFQERKKYTVEISRWDYDDGASDYASILVENDDWYGPAAVSNFTVTPNTANTYKLDWTNPTLNRRGETLTTLTSIKVYQNNTLIYTKESPAAGAAETYTATITYPGTHTFSVIASSQDGDGASAIKTITTCAGTVAAFPWAEGFEEDVFPPSCWNIINIAGTASWDQYDLSPFRGTKSAAHDYAQGKQKSALVTPRIAVPKFGNPKLDFYSYIRLSPYEHCGIWVSKTSNSDFSTFTEVHKLTAEEARIGSWNNIVVPLNDFYGDSIYIAFLYDNTYGVHWNIDSITISHLESWVDVEAVSIIPQSGDHAVLTNNEQITVKLKNRGGSAVANFNLNLLLNGNLAATEEFTETITSASEVSYTFNKRLDLSAAGVYKIQVIVAKSGDRVSSNDTVISTVRNTGCSLMSTFPYQQDFENTGMEKYALPACWTQEQITGVANWVVVSTSDLTASPSATPVNAYSGQYRVAMYSIGSGHITRLVAPPANISSLGNPVLKFHHVQIRDGLYQDSLGVFYKTSSRGEWKLLEKYTNEVADWTERVIPLPEPSGEYYIAFEGYCQYGQSVQLDAIFIGEYAETDIAVTDISPKGTNLDLSDNQQIKATIRNNGRNTASGFKLSLYNNGVLVATENFAGSIEGLGEEIHTFAATVDLSVSGKYTLAVAANLTGDEIKNNDSLSVEVKNLVCNAITFPFEEGFEDEVFPPHCWTKSGTDWLKEGYNAHTGHGRARHNWYEGARDGWLISPKFSIPAGKEYMLEFWSHCYDASDYSYSGVWISTTDNNPVSFTEFYELSGSEIPESVWTKIALSLNEYAGKNIYIAFRFRGNGQNGHIWSLDDISVYDLEGKIDAEVVSITAPPALGVNMTDQEPVTVQLKNNGSAAITEFELKLEHNGSVVATETYSGSIASLATANYSFQKKVDLSAAGASTVKVTVILDGDAVIDNNSKTQTVNNNICSVITSFPWQGSFWNGTGGGAGTAFTDCWINIDADKDAFKWWIGEDRGNYYAISESYNSEYEFPLMPDNWLVTPPVRPDKPYYFSFKVGSLDTITRGKEKYSILISEAGISPENFTEIKTETLNPADYTEGFGGYGFKTVHIPLTECVGKTIHIAFRHWGCTNQDMLLITDIKVWEFSDYIDGEVVEILSPKSGPLTNQEEVKVKLKNNGGQAISNFDIKLNNGTSNITETYTGSIPSLSTIDYTLQQKIDLSNNDKAHTITVSIEVEGDAVADNNSKSVTVANFPSEAMELRGYRTFDESWTTASTPRSFVKFSTANPSVVSTVNNFAFDGDANTITSGEYADGSLYFYTAKVNNETGQAELADFVKADAETFVSVTNTPVTDYVEDMAYDPTTNILYGVDFEENLVSIDFENGTMTSIGSLGRFLYTLACDKDGKLYGVDEAGNFCSVNKTTGATTIIGNTGVIPYWAQSMAFDHKTGRLFWAMTNAQSQGKLLEIHVGSGICYDRGTLGNNATVVSLYVPSGETSIDNNLTVAGGNPLKAWVEDGRLYVSGLVVGENWQVYSVEGKLIYQSIAGSEVVSVKPGIRGLYIIQSGNRVVKVVY